MISNFQLQARNVSPFAKIAFHALCLVYTLVEAMHFYRDTCLQFRI